MRSKSYSIVNPLGKIIVCQILIFIVLLTNCLGAPPENDADCQYLNNMVTLVQKQMGQLSTCATEGNFATPALRSANHMCIMKCALTKLGVLNSEGTIDIVGTMNLMESSIPPSFREESSGLLLKCQDTAAKLDPKDETCSTYQDLINCALTSITSGLRGSMLKILTSGGLGSIIGNGNSVSPLKMVRCGIMGGRAEGELSKLNINSLRRIF